jgi:hypothetical protein
MRQTTELMLPPVSHHSGTEPRSPHVGDAIGYLLGWNEQERVELARVGMLHAVLVACRGSHRYRAGITAQVSQRVRNLTPHLGRRNNTLDHVCDPDIARRLEQASRVAV